MSPRTPSRKVGRSSDPDERQATGDPPKKSGFLTLSGHLEQSQDPGNERKGAETRGGRGVVRAQCRIGEVCDAAKAYLYQK